MTNLTVQTQIDRDKAALVNPESAKQVMDIADRSARLVRAYKGMKGYEEQYYKAFEVMIEAYHIVGEELAQMEKATGELFRGSQQEPRRDTPTLSDLGITKKQSYEWQSIALVPRADVEEYIRAKKEESEPVTKSAILEIAQNYKTAQQRYDEEVDRVVATMNAFIIQARRVTNHRLKYSDITLTTKEELFETLKLCGEILDELNRTTM